MCGSETECVSVDDLGWLTGRLGSCDTDGGVGAGCGEAAFRGLGIGLDGGRTRWMEWIWALLS